MTCLWFRTLTRIKLTCFTDVLPMWLISTTVLNKACWWIKQWRWVFLNQEIFHCIIPASFLKIHVFIPSNLAIHPLLHQLTRFKVACHRRVVASIWYGFKWVVPFILRGKVIWDRGVHGRVAVPVSSTICMTTHRITRHHNLEGHNPNLYGKQSSGKYGFVMRCGTVYSGRHLATYGMNFLPQTSGFLPWRWR
jgi:hypothetical protein